MKKKLLKILSAVMTVILVLSVFTLNVSTVRAEDDGDTPGDTRGGDDPPVPLDEDGITASISVVNGTRKTGSPYQIDDTEEYFNLSVGDDLELGFMEPLEGYFTPQLNMNGNISSISKNSSVWKGAWNIEYFINDSYPNGWVRITGYNIPNSNDFTLTFLPIDYQIAFDPNGGEGVMEEVNAKYDETITLPKNEFKYSGYVFNGWNTDPEGGGTSYANKASVKNLTTERDSVVTLYAQWKERSTPDPEPSQPETEYYIPVTGID